MPENRRFPIGATVRMSALSNDPYPFFQQLQDEEPVSWVEEIRMWFITRRADVLNVLADTATFTVRHPDSVLKDVLGTNMLTTDGDEQYRLRKPFVATFAPRTIRERAAATIDRLVNMLIDDFIGQGQADIKTAFADKLAVLTVADALGLPITDYAQFRQWYFDYAEGLGNFTHDAAIAQRAQQAKLAFHEYVMCYLHGEYELVAGSELARVQAEGSLTAEEIVDAARVIIFGGVETTAALIANSLWALLQHPAQLELVRSDPGHLPNAIEETLRWESPVQTATRHITQDVQIGGVEMRSGEMLQCMLGAANRDAAHFVNPSVYDIHRKNASDHLTFGHGRHYCVGAALARMEAQTAVKYLLERLPGLHLHPDFENKPRGHEFRSPSSLVLRWGV